MSVQTVNTLQLMSDNWDIGTLSELHILFEWYVYIRNKLVVTDLFDRFVYWVFLQS